MKIIRKDMERVSEFLKALGALYKVWWSDDLSFNEKAFIIEGHRWNSLTVICEIASIQSEFMGTGDFRERVHHHGFYEVTPVDILFHENRMNIENDAPVTWNPQCMILFRPIGATQWYNVAAEVVELKEEYLWKLRVLPHEYYDTVYNHFALKGWHYADSIELPEEVEIRRA